MPSPKEILAINQKILQNTAQLVDKTVHIYYVNLRVRPERLQALWSLLLDDEKNKSEKFISPFLRESFIVSRGTLRLILSQYLAKNPKELILRQGKYGKPYIDTNRLPLQFNITHSKDFALFAFTLRNHIGIDIEFIQEDFAYKDLISQYFSQQEQNDLLALPEEQQREAFFTCWTRKEAFIKEIGQGLSFPLDAFDVDISNGERDQPLSIYVHDKNTIDKEYFLYPLNIIRGYVAALAIDIQLHKICCWSLP